MIILFDKTTHDKLAYLDDIIIEDSLSITRQINGEFTLIFEVMEANIKSIYLETETYILCDGYYYDIAYVEKEHADSLCYHIECEHVSYRLINNKLPFYTSDGTPQDILSDILQGTDFTPGQIDSTQVMTFAMYEEGTKLAMIQKLGNSLGLMVDFNGFSISLKDTIGQNRSFTAQFGKNLTGIRKIIDRRNQLTYYDIDLIELKNHPDFAEFANFETVDVGDTIRIIDKAMAIDTENMVVKKTYDPIRSINTSLEIANSIELLTDSITQIQRDTVIKGNTYHGIRISPDSGFESIRSDKLARGIFNSDTFAFQVGDGSGENWTNKLYFDPVAGKYIFDGVLSASMIEALEAEFDVTISNTFITQTLAADKGYIAELTVDSLETSTKVQKYLNNDISDVDFIRIEGKEIEFITATTDGESTEQAINRKGYPIYWTDSSHEGTTLEVTNYPVVMYTYAEVTKLKMFFEHDGTYNIPIIEMGHGDSVTEDSAKARIIKKPTGLEIIYYRSGTGDEVKIQMTDEGFVDADMRRLKSAIINRANGTIQTMAEGKTIGDEETITFVETSNGITYTWPDGFVTTVSIS